MFDCIFLGHAQVAPDTHAKSSWSKSKSPSETMPFLTADIQVGYLWESKEDLQDLGQECAQHESPSKAELSQSDMVQTQTDMEGVC